MLESIYSACLAHLLNLRGIEFCLESELPVNYKGTRIAANLRADLIVEKELIVELKCVARVESVHKAQLLSYLRMGCMSRGLLINFNVALLRDGVFRVANNYVQNS